VTAALVLPLGQLIGTMPDDSAGGHHHGIRRGGVVEELSDAELAAWAVAHGPPDDEASPQPWTATALRTHLAGLDVPDPAAIVDRLLARDLLVEVALDAEGGPEFARGHRAVPILYGLGNSAEEPWMYGIGLLGHEMIQVTRPIFELWAWAHLDDNLWLACQTFAETERAAGGTDPEVCDPARVLIGFLSALHGLLGMHAVYLDVLVGDR
jgi:hypothetical protein